MNVTLINPNYGERVVKQGGITIQYNKVYQPLSLGYIASLLFNDKDINFDVRVIDLNFEELSIIKKLNTDIAVITTGDIYYWQCPYPKLHRIKEIVDMLKCRYIILNGPHGTTNPEYVFNEVSKKVIIVKGEPELITYSLIKKITKRESFFNMEAIAFVKDNKIINNKGLGEFIFDELPIPAYHFMQMDNYGYDLMPGKFSIMETTRNCPYNCTFCLKVMHGKFYSMKLIDKVIEEIKLLIYKYRVKNIFFIDLEFTINKNRTIKLCKRILDEGLKFNWAIQARVDKVDKELLKLMKKAGCVLIHYGVESGDATILKNTNKMVNLQQIKKAFKLTRKIGIRSLAYLIIGHPYETKEQIKKTIKFAQEINPDIASFVIMMPYPGTAVYEKLKEKVKVYDLSANISMDLDELEALRISAIKKFYLRPNYIFTQLKSIRSYRDILFLIKGFLNVFLPLTKNTKN